MGDDQWRIWDLICHFASIFYCCLFNGRIRNGIEMISTDFDPQIFLNSGSDQMRIQGFRSVFFPVLLALALYRT